MSFVVAIPAVLLLVMIVLNGMAYGGNMFSGMMTVVVAITGLTVLGLGLSPFAVMAFYPTEGFGSSIDPPPAATPSSPPAGSDDEDDEDDEELEEALDDEMGADELYDDDGEDLDDDEWE